MIAFRTSSPRNPRTPSHNRIILMGFQYTTKSGALEALFFLAFRRFSTCFIQLLEQLITATNLS